MDFKGGEGGGEAVPKLYFDRKRSRLEPTKVNKPEVYANALPEVLQLIHSA